MYTFLRERPRRVLLVDRDGTRFHWLMMLIRVDVRFKDRFMPAFVHTYSKVETGGPREVMSWSWN